MTPTLPPPPPSPQTFKKLSLTFASKERGQLRAPVGALERVERERGALHAAGRLAGRVRGEPVVGKHRVWRTVPQRVLEQRHAHARHLPQLAG